MRIYLKVFVLILALVGVVYAIRNVNEASMAHFLGVFGVEPGTAESPGLMAAGRAVGEGEERMSICPNRVQSITFEVDGTEQVITEANSGKRQWVAITSSLADVVDGEKKSAGPTELPYMEVEKWFSQHCQIVVKRYPSAEGITSDETGIEPVTIKYIDGSEKAFLRVMDSNSTDFVVGDQAFDSKDFADALDELKRIAQFQ